MDLRSPVRTPSGATLPTPRGRRRARRLLVAGCLLASAAAGLVGFAAVTSPPGARAVAYDASHLSLSQGASTITEQLAKQLYLEGNDRSPIRKIQDAILAFRHESVLSKDQILAAYLNTVYFGESATGVGAASARYSRARQGSVLRAMVGAGDVTQAQPRARYESRFLSRRGRPSRPHPASGCRPHPPYRRPSSSLVVRC